jgi:hypothetical protein
VLLWELLYGRRPYPHEQMEDDWAATLEAFTRRRREEPPVSPEPLGKDPVHRELHAVLKKCVAADPEDRYADGAELGRQFWLCTRPLTQMLLKSPHQGWRSRARRHPITAFIIAILLPHVFAAVFNFVYNKAVIIDEVARTNPRAVDVFEVVAACINLTFFPGGLALLIFLVWPVYKALVRTEQADPRLMRWVERWRRGFGAQAPAPEAAAGTTKQMEPSLPELIETARLRSLRLPFFAAALGMTLWGLAGATYPLLLPLTWMQAIHFALSLIVCGMIAGVYPFFTTAYLAIRVFYPALLTASPAAPSEQQPLRGLVKETGGTLLCTVVVPLIGASMVYVGQRFGLQNILVDIALAGLFLAGVAGVIIAFRMYQRIRDDVEALVEAAQPTDTHMAHSTTVITKRE